jgi:predicted dehydrogenase
VASGKIRVGLIGVGNWAAYGHIPALQLLPEYEVTAVHARRHDHAETIAAKFGIPHVLDTPEAVARHPDVDMVLVLTTAPQHADGVRAAIAAGKHVYSEWPLTTSSTIAEELLESARAAGVRHVVGLQRRLSPTTRYLHDLIRDGYVGKLRSVRLHVSMNYFQDVRANALRWTVPPENFSSVIAIYAGHFLDMLFAVTGRPVSHQSLMVNQFKQVTIRETGEVIPTTTPDQLVMAGRLADDAVFSVHVETKRNGSGVQLDITGDEGDLKVTNVSAFGDVGEDYVIEGAHGDKLALELLPVPAGYDWMPPSGLASSVIELGQLYAAFARDLEDGTRTAPTFEDGVWLHRLFDGMAASSETGARVAVGPDDRLYGRRHAS